MFYVPDMERRLEMNSSVKLIEFLFLMLASN